jgi:hypothetical protein
MSLAGEGGAVIRQSETLRDSPPDQAEGLNQRSTFVATLPLYGANATAKKMNATKKISPNVIPNTAAQIARSCCRGGGVAD